MSLGGDAPTPPPAPDPGQVAGQQAAYNTQAGQQSQAGSMVNQSGPSGSLTYSQTGTGPNGVPIYTANTQLSPEQQALVTALAGNKLDLSKLIPGLAKSGTANMDSAGNMISGASSDINRARGLLDTAGGALSFGNYGTTNASDAVGDATKGITKRMLDQKVSYLTPYFEQDVASLDAKLRNQGVAPGNPAYNRAMDQLKQSQNRSVTDFMASAEPQAFQEATASYNLPASTAAMIASLTGSALAPGSAAVGQGGALGSLGGNQLGAANGMLGTTAPTMPTINQTPALNIQPPNYQGAVATSADIQQKNYQSELAQQQNMMSGMFGIPTAVLGGWAQSGGLSSALSALPMLSDRRLKTDIVKVGDWIGGLPTYLFRYLWSPFFQIGVMADEVEEVMPEAVYTVDGYKAVNYAMILGRR